MKKAFLCMMAVLGMALMLASCKPSLPSDVLSKGKMTDILFDYHLALAMARSEAGGNGDGSKAIAYREAVLKKHDVTSAEFDSSMVYYMRHTELLEAVYKDLSDRMSNEAVALGGNGSTGEFDNLSATGDTANIWNQASSMVFAPQPAFNEVSFKIDADSSFHKGDKLMLDFEAQFLYQDGMRDGIALLAIEFKNDSVAQAITHISSSMHYSVQVSDNDSLGIKSVKGYFLLSNGGFSSDMGSQTTLKLMFLDNVKLIRMHAQKPVAPSASATVPPGGVRPDSASGPSGAPSVSGPSGAPNGPSGAPSVSGAPAIPSGAAVPLKSGPRPNLPKEGSPAPTIRMMKAK